MSDAVQMTLIVTLFRGAMILVGFGFAILGYRLFVKGVYEKAGDLKAAWGERNLVLKQAAPGTFFALFGVAVIAISIVRSAGIEAPKEAIYPKISSGNVISYPNISKLLEENKVSLKESSDLWHLEMAVLHNIRSVYAKAGLPPDYYIDTFRDVLAPILQEEPSKSRGGRIKNVQDYLLENLSSPASRPLEAANQRQQFSVPQINKQSPSKDGLGSLFD